jgi:hypothetical protein
MQDENGLCVGCHGLKPMGECCQDRPDLQKQPAQVRSLIDRIATRHTKVREGLVAYGVSIPCGNEACDRRTVRGDYCCKACEDSDGLLVVVELHTAQCDFETETRKAATV